MIVNKQINEALKSIGEETVKYLNTPDKQRQYLKRMLSLYKNNLTEEEQLFMMKLLLEQLNYKNIIVDPDTILAIGNVKNRTIFVIFVLTVCSMLIASYLFKSNQQFTSLVDMLIKAFKFVF